MRYSTSRIFLLILMWLLTAGYLPLKAQNRFEEDMKKAEQFFRAYNYYTAKGFYKSYEAQLRPDERYKYAVCLINDTYRTEADKAEFLRQLKLSADNGEMRAMQWLAEIYLQGELTAQNTSEALRLLSSLCSYEQPKAMYMYGMILNEGKWTKRDTARAYRWVARAAEKKYREAFGVLAYWHYSGSGAPKDREKAKNYWKEAAKEGDKDAGYNYALLQLENPAETTLGLKELEWNGANNHVPSLLLLARVYEEGLYTIKKNPAKSLNYYKQIIITDNVKEKHPDAYRTSLEAVRREGSVEPGQDSKALRAAFDQAASRIRQGGGAKTVGERMKTVSDAYKPLEALGFRTGRIVQRLKGDAKSDSAWIRTPYHIYETKIVHTVEEEVAVNVFLRWNRILQRTYPEYNMEGDAYKSSLILPLPQQEKIALVLENTSEEVLLKMIYYKNVTY